MIKRPDVLKLGEAGSHLKLSYVKKVGQSSVEPVWNINGADEMTLRLIRDLNLAEMGEILSGKRFSQGFAYILANPLTSKADIQEQREAIREASKPENAAKLDDIVTAMYDFGLKKETINNNSWGINTSKRLRLLREYSNIVQKLAEFSSFKTKLFQDIGEYANQILQSNEYLFVPMTTERGLNYFKLTMEITENVDRNQGQIRFIKSKFGPKIPTANILKHLGHRIKGRITFMFPYYNSARWAVKSLVEKNVTHMTDTLQLLPVFEFYRSLINYESQINGNGKNVHPELADTTEIISLEHPLRTLKVKKPQQGYHYVIDEDDYRHFEGDEDEEDEKPAPLKKEESSESNLSVPNDYKSDKSHSTLLITGANNGGKTYYSKTVGVSQLLSQRGTKIVAQKASISIVDRVYTHFVASDDPIHGEGRYKFELRRMDEILEKCTPRSLIIADEPCGGTDPAMGQVQSSYFLEALSKTGAQVIFNTHYHQLADMADSFSQIQNIHPDTRFENGKLIYLYRMLPGPAGTSFALEVAKSMNLGRDALIKKAQRARNR